MSKTQIELVSRQSSSYKGMFNQASNVDGTGTQTHDRVNFMSSSSTTQLKDSGDLNLEPDSNTLKTSV